MATLLTEKYNIGKSPNAQNLLLELIPKDRILRIGKTIYYVSSMEKAELMHIPHYETGEADESAISNLTSGDIKKLLLREARLYELMNKMLGRGEEKKKEKKKDE